MSVEAPFTQEDVEQEGRVPRGLRRRMPGERTCPLNDAERFVNREHVLHRRIRLGPELIILRRKETAEFMKDIDGLAAVVIVHSEKVSGKVDALLHAASGGLHLGLLTTEELGQNVYSIRR
ncbi:hypothetical protein FMN50_26160 [Rhodobacterales bacterium]|nr:hypothetical protein FMN50_26160 [Rhodobacterales bacterium]